MWQCCRIERRLRHRVVAAETLGKQPSAIGESKSAINVCPATPSPSDLRSFAYVRTVATATQLEQTTA